MNSFSEYMDKVKAEKELKEKTETFVRTALLNAEQKAQDSGLEFRKKRFFKNKFLVAVSAAACTIMVVAGNAYYHMPVNYVSLDINPSVELGINSFGRVVSVQAYNEDGLQLLGDSEYSNLSVEDAISTLVLDASEQGFIAEDGTTVIAVTAESDNKEAAAELQSDIEEGANSALSLNGISAVVYSDYADLQIREQSAEMGISPGKLRLILILQELDPSITIEDYKDAKITDIISKASELLSQAGNGSQNENYAEVFNKICNAADKVQTARLNAEREQNRNREQYKEESSCEQVQNQTQNQYSTGQEQIQSQGSDEPETQNQVQLQGEAEQQAPNQSLNTGKQEPLISEEQAQDKGSGIPDSGQSEGQRGR